MNRGHIRQLAAPEVVSNDPANPFGTRFIESPGMNLVHGSLAEALAASRDTADDPAS